MFSFELMEKAERAIEEVKAAAWAAYGHEGDQTAKFGHQVNMFLYQGGRCAAASVERGAEFDASPIGLVVREMAAELNARGVTRERAEALILNFTTSVEKFIEIKMEIAS